MTIGASSDIAVFGSVEWIVRFLDSSIVSMAFFMPASESPLLLHNAIFPGSCINKRYIKREYWQLGRKPWSASSLTQLAANPKKFRERLL